MAWVQSKKPPRSRQVSRAAGKGGEEGAAGDVERTISSLLSQSQSASWQLHVAGCVWAVSIREEMSL